MEQGKHIKKDIGSDLNRDRKLRKFLKILLALLALHIIWSFTGTIFLSFILRTEVTGVTYVSHCIEVQGLLGFKEKVVTSSKGGKLTWLLAEGDMVSVGTKVAKITGPGGEEILTSPVPGIFSPYIDGLEGIVYPHLDWVPEKDVFLNILPRDQGFQAGDQVPAGSPVFKVISNFTWYYSLVLTEDELALLPEGRRIGLEFGFDDTTYPVESFKVHDLGAGSSFVTFSLSRDAGDFYRRRWEDARIIYDQETGVSVPFSAIVTKNDQKGIYRYVRSALIFVEVDIMAEETEEKQFVVRGLEPGWMIVTNPRFFREGQRFF